MLSDETGSRRVWAPLLAGLAPPAGSSPVGEGVGWAKAPRWEGRESPEGKKEWDRGREPRAGGGGILIKKTDKWVPQVFVGTKYEV
jgi:hypothetical protein